MVFQTLNKLKWEGGLDEVNVIILSRGSPEDRKTIPGTKITDIKRTHFYYKDNSHETFIPNHRVMMITKGKEILWQRKETET